MSKWHGGKGSSPRPSGIDPAKWEENYERVFGPKKKTKEKKDERN